MFFVVDIKDKLLEIKDLFSKLNNQPTTLEICKNSHEFYINNPTIKNKEKLKVSYENIPKHHRKYVGDMNTKDFEIRKIIYE